MINRNIIPTILYQATSRHHFQMLAANANCMTMMNLLTFRRNLKPSQSHRLLHHLTNIAQICNATDSHNKIYSFLKFTTEEEHSTISINYNKSITVVYHKVSQTFIEQGNGIQILHEAVGSHFMDGLPSWAPNWAEGKFQLSLADNGDSHAFAAICTARSRIELSRDRKVLSVRGIRIDSIQAMTRPLVNHDDASRALALRNFCLAGRSLLQQHADDLRYGTEEYILEVHWRTLVCDMKRDPSPQSIISRPAPSNFGDAYLSWLALEKASTARMKAYPFVSAVDIMSDWKRFGVTRDGYTALLPGRAKYEDIICVFLGATVPFVIRRKASGNYLLVGECYVHGLMDGEALDLVLDREELNE